MPGKKIEMPPVGVYHQYEGKLRDEEIASVLGISRSLLIRWKQEWGIRHHYQKDKLTALMSKEEQYWRLSRKGLYDYEIAKRFGIHPNSMHRLKRLWRENK